MDDFQVLCFSYRIVKWTHWYKKKTFLMFFCKNDRLNECILLFSVIFLSSPLEIALFRDLNAQGPNLVEFTFVSWDDWGTEHRQLTISILSKWFKISSVNNHFLTLYLYQVLLYVTRRLCERKNKKNDVQDIERGRGEL